jgi:hypothetical protein
VTVNGTTAIQFLASRISNGLNLFWNSQPDVAYRAQVNTNLTQTNWIDVSGSIIAAGTSAS